MLILDLVENFALIVAYLVAHQLILRRYGRQMITVKLLSGLLFGLLGVFVMLTPVMYLPGIFFDGRSVVLSVAGLFGGVPVAAIAGSICVLFRTLQGGSGTVMGVGVIVSSATIGVLFSYLRRKNESIMKPLPLLGFGMLVHIVMLVWIMALPTSSRLPVLRTIGIPILTIYPIATMFVSMIFVDTERRFETEKALAESETTFRNIFDYHKAIKLLLDNETGKIVDANKAALNFYGWPLETLQNHDHPGYQHPPPRGGAGGDGKGQPKEAGLFRVLPPDSKRRDQGCGGLFQRHRGPGQDHASLDYSRCHRTQRAQGPAYTGAENGIDRPSRRWCRPRFQQSHDRGARLLRAGNDGA